MKFINIIVLAIFFSGCSFDDKTGIWKNQNSAEDIKKKILLMNLYPYHQTKNILIK